MYRLPLRRYLFLLVVAGVLPLAILSGVGLLVLYESQRDEIRRRAQEIVRAQAIAVEAELQRSIAALQVMASTPRLQAGDLREFREIAALALETQPHWLGVRLATPSGDRVLDTGVPEGRSMAPVMERESFDEVLRTLKPVVGDLAPRDGVLSFALRVPVISQGKVRYVLSAVISPRAVLRIVERQDLPADWVSSVFDGHGMRVARSRLHEEYLGQPGSPTLVELMKGGAREGVGTTHALEGEPIVSAFTRMEGGWAVAIGLPLSLASAAGTGTLALYAGAVLLSIVLGLLAAWWLARRANLSMAQLRGAALALGRGERPEVASSHIGEVQDVAEAIVTAARDRAAIEAEREELLQREQGARAEAENASRAKDEFLAMLAHELRNPLAAISNASELLDSPRATPEVGGRAREVIRRQTRHLAKLTDDLLDAARALLGKIPLERRPIDLAVVASRSLRTLEGTGRLGSHKVSQDLGEAWVDADAVRMEQVACNLLENAVKYTPRGGSIQVRTHAVGDEAILVVSDSGTGIAPDLLPRVFELFVQGERGLDRSQGGLGIGLTLVKRLVELHGGRVEARSEGGDRGSEFTVRLPRVDKPAQVMPREVGHPAARTILVIEDNDDARETLVTLLETLGHRVEPARDGVQGLDMALAMAPDIAFVDIGLPGFDGYELARRLRAAGDDKTYLVALTGYGNAQDRDRVLDAGFDAHLTKPAQLSDLEPLIAGASKRLPTALTTTQR